MSTEEAGIKELLGLLSEFAEGEEEEQKTFLPPQDLAAPGQDPDRELGYSDAPPKERARVVSIKRSVWPNSHVAYKRLLELADKRELLVYDPEMYWTATHWFLRAMTKESV